MIDAHRDDRTDPPKLRVTVREQLGCVSGFGVVGDHAGGAVGTHPPELPPVVLVMVRENRDRGIDGDVPEALEVRRRFWFCVDREVQRVSIHRKNNRHDVRPSLIAHRRKASDLGLSKTPLCIAGFHEVKSGRTFSHCGYR
jgi:hypothetical protein